jgi:tight adherence protein B
MAGWLIAGGVFVIVVGLTIGLLLGLSRMPEFLATRRLNKRLKDVGTPVEQPIARGDALIKVRQEGPLPAFDRFAGRTTRGSALGRWLDQSGLTVSISGVVLMSFGLAGMFALSALMFGPWYVPLAAGLAGGSLPFLVLQNRRKARLKRFEEHFPEALDLMARAVKAGHAFNTAIKMVADEMPEPVGPEFRKTFDEQNFGLPLKDALNNLGERISLLDVRFFVTAVLIQRETGGNLSEILENLAHVVRERFKILRQVRVYTAHGRFTGYVLLGLPAALSIALMFINPEHMNLLFREPIGQKLLMAAIGLQVMGYMWIKKVVKIEV